GEQVAGVVDHREPLALLRHARLAGSPCGAGGTRDGVLSDAARRGSIVTRGIRVGGGRGGVVVGKRGIAGRGGGAQALDAGGRADGGDGRTGAGTSAGTVIGTSAVGPFDVVHLAEQVED